MIMQGISAVLLDPGAILWVFVGTLVGILFGCIPGLTATMAIAMFLPMTYGMAATEGQATLMALYIGGISGGLISAILLNIPGTPASMATCLDGTPLARKGQAGKALGVGIVFSFMGTILSLLALVGISPALANIAIKFGPWEYFSITVFSLTLIITLSEENLVKGLITGIIGLMLATVGLAPIDSVSRYTFGSNALNGGFDILTVLVGVFAISEILLAAENSHKPSASQKATVITDFNIKGFGFSLKEFFSQIPNCIRSALIGIGLGILPGIGSGTSNMLSYTIAKNQSKHPEKFGTGIIDGVVASETANNATIGGTIIPLLTLVFVLCMVGAYGTNNRIFDCWALIFFGLVGYLLRKGNFPTTPLILGFVLGSIMELNFRRALSYSNGNYMEFITHPISGVFLAIALFSLIFNLYHHHKRIQSKKA